MADIYFQELVIDKISTNSGMFTGSNRMRDYHHQQKINDGFGRNAGYNNCINWNQTVLIDRDIVDLGKENTNKRNESG